MTWRDEYAVNVGWVGKPELGYLRCEVSDTWPDRAAALPESHPVRSVRWAHGKQMQVTWSHSEGRYVFAPIHPTCTIVHR